MAKDVTEDTVILVNLSGRGDKDLAHVHTILEPSAKGDA
jgi:tryptophan synthase beta chain